MEMTSGIKNFGEEIVGSRVKVWWPKDNKFCEGGCCVLWPFRKEKLGRMSLSEVVYTNSVEEILKKEPVEDVSFDQEKTCTLANASSSIIPEMATGDKDHGEELVGCKVKVWWPKDKRCREGVVASYDPVGKKHLVVYTNGIGEMLNLRKEHVGTFNQKTGTSAHASAYMMCDDDMNSLCHVRKKHKGQSLDLVKLCSRSMMSEDEKEKELENRDNELVNFNGYRVKATTVPILEAVFAKYGDIAANCLYKSTAVRASLLEVISDVVKRLQYYDVEVILSELKQCNDKTRLLKKAKVNSGLVLRASTKELKQRHAELVEAQKQFKEAEKRVNAMKLVGQRIEDDVQESEAVEYFWRRQLEGLL
ncbi:hypothetical protein Adt_45582 [Abeliophyllum distichum]|uniref:Uncharacterized protein n=1 Tax=Abeliophyllum distichum TaxID=126358 RepID=A0ABD1PE84_9LAMI